MRQRTLGLLAGAFLVAALALGGVSAALARGSGGMMSGWGPWGYGPAGMMGGGGMMGGNGPMGGGTGANPSGQPLSLDQAQQAVEAYLGGLRNPDLAVDEVMEFQRNVYAVVK